MSKFPVMQLHFTYCQFCFLLFAFHPLLTVTFISIKKNRHCIFISNFFLHTVISLNSVLHLFLYPGSSTTFSFKHSLLILYPFIEISTATFRYFLSFEASVKTQTPKAPPLKSLDLPFKNLLPYHPMLHMIF
jgi:hypothetical protein